MRARRLVGSSLSLMLVATVLVAVGVGSPGRAQSTRVKKQSDPGNSAKDVTNPGPKVLPVVGKPEPLGGVLVDPKGDGKTPDWFLKTDDASRAAALAAQKVTLAPTSVSVQTDKNLPGGAAAPSGSEASELAIRALVPELVSSGSRKVGAAGLSKESRRAARLAERDPVVVEGQDTAKTARGVSSKRQEAEPPASIGRTGGQVASTSSVGPAGGVNPASGVVVKVPSAPTPEAKANANVIGIDGKPLSATAKPSVPENDTTVVASTGVVTGVRGLI